MTTRDKTNTCASGVADSDSVNLGSNPSSPAIENIEKYGLPALGNLGSMRTDSEAGSTEPGTVGTGDVPLTPAEFERWLNERRADMSVDLLAKAERALLTLKTLNQPNAAKSEAFMQASKDDLRAFADSWTSHV